MGRLKLALGLAATVSVVATAGALATHGPDAEVTVGSNDAVMLQNKQNEPGVAINPIAPNIVAAGANDNIDLEACNVGADTTCPFTPGVGLSGVQFSTNGGASWVQPTYTGYSARNCLGVAGTATDTCAPDPDGPIGTLPNYFENGLVSNGDPIVAFGPQRDASGDFSWDNGWRLYYSNIATNFSAERDEQAFKGAGAIAVSRLDEENFAAALAGDNDAWFDPVIVTKQNSALFSDKEVVWADNAEASPFFGNVYVCNVAFRSIGGAPEPVVVSRSTDGGDTWETRQLTSAANTGLGQGRQGCTVRTDSEGVVYVFFSAADKKKDNPPFFDSAQLLARSFDGGRTFERPFKVADVQECGLLDPVQGRLTFDGVAGARTNSFPSVDIANGAPSGANAPDTIVLTWCDGPTPSTTAPGPNEQAPVQVSADRGESWTAPVNGAPAADRPDFPAIAISPDGTDVYLTYMNFFQPWQSSALTPARTMEGVVRYAPLTGTGLAAFVDKHRGEDGDARGSTANGLVAEFLGDYNWVSATNSFAVAVWNDVRDAASCTAINTYRQNLVTGTTPNPPPAPQQQCPVGTDTFGNSDIYGTVVTP
jgi:hypothetical protein